MKKIGGLIFVVGLCLTLAQVHLYMEAGYWRHFTLGDLLHTEIDGGQFPIVSEWLDRTLTWLLTWESGPSMLVLGAVLFLLPSAGRRFDDIQASRVLHNFRRDFLRDRQTPSDS